MIQQDYTIRTNQQIAADTYEMVLTGDTSAITRPGQFVNLKLNGFFLRRPISVCDYTENTLTLIYKVVGNGTATMAAMQAGQSLNLLTGLGNGYDISKSGKHPLLIGGGAGVPPLFGLAKALLRISIHPQILLGFNTAKEVFYADRFVSLYPRASATGAAAAPLPVYLTTVDGSMGKKGFVTDVMQTLNYDYFFTCGPMPMFKAIEAIANTSGQYSFEERMGCGFGACMGCSCMTKSGSKRICKEGPVLEREEILW